MCLSPELEGDRNLPFESFGASCGALGYFFLSQGYKLTHSNIAVNISKLKGTLEMC